MREYLSACLGGLAAFALLALLESSVGSLLATPAVLSPPDRKVDETAEPKPIPNLSGLSNWGSITQQGRTLNISGHPNWSAAGEIRKDGTVYLLWEAIADGRRAPGVYKVEGQKLIGDWGWGDEVTIESDGSLTGRLMSDRIVRLPVEP